MDGVGILGKCQRRALAEEVLRLRVLRALLESTLKDPKSRAMIKLDTGESIPVFNIFPLRWHSMKRKAGRVIKKGAKAVA